MKKILLHTLAVLSFFVASLTPSLPAYAGYCQVCAKREDSTTLQQPVWTNACVSGGTCDGCKYYFTPEWDCDYKLGSWCTITTNPHISTVVYTVGCDRGCHCPGTGGSKQPANIDVAGENCT